MSDNIALLDANATAVDLKTFDSGTGHIPIHRVESSALPAGAATAALQTSGTQKVIIASATDTAKIEERPFTGVKGLCVNIGPTDPISDIPVVMEFEHHQVHEGETYRAESAALSATQQFTIVTGAHANDLHAPHMIISAAVYSGTIRMQLYEGQAGATIGTALAKHNRHRNRTDASTAVISPCSGATGTTLLDTVVVAAGNGTTASRATAEWILKPSTTYLVVATEVAAFSDTYIHFDWYEDTGV